MYDVDFVVEKETSHWEKLRFKSDGHCHVLYARIIWAVNS